MFDGFSIIDKNCKSKFCWCSSSYIFKESNHLLVYLFSTKYMWTIKLKNFVLFAERRKWHKENVQDSVMVVLLSLAMRKRVFENDKFVSTVLQIHETMVSNVFQPYNLI